MNLARHHRVALAGALGLSAIALFDAVTHGLTGHWSAFSDDGQNPAIRAAGEAVHGLAYAGAVWVLVAERRRLHANRRTTVFAWVLALSFAALAAGFLVAAPFTAAAGARPAVAFFEPVIGAAFALQFLAAIGLGLALLRHAETGVGSRLLAATVPVLALTLVLASVAPAWAHPAYVETTTILGVALLGTAVRPLRAASDRTGSPERSLS